MTGSLLRTAFDNVAGHFSNFELMGKLVQELETHEEPIDEVIKILEEKSEGAEITLRTDIRILINECRHLKSRKTTR